MSTSSMCTAEKGFSVHRHVSTALSLTSAHAAWKEVLSILLYFSHIIASVQFVVGLLCTTSSLLYCKARSIYSAILITSFPTVFPLFVARSECASRAPSVENEYSLNTLIFTAPLVISLKSSVP